MKALSLHDVLLATGGELLASGGRTEFNSVHTDSRKKEDNALFVPIVGQRVDGHDFIKDAFANGAAGALTQRPDDMVPGGVLIAVEDTRRALQDIARFHRLRFDLPVAAVTGSAGKTTTKDMIACALSATYAVMKTEGNFNSRVGLPLTLLRLEERHQAAVVEIGMNDFGEIAELSRVALPDAAVVTNVGLSHIEQLGSQENILREKLDITVGLRETGRVILNGDDPLLAGCRERLPHKTVFYGLADWCDYRAEKVNATPAGSAFELVYPGGRQPAFIPLAGLHNICNALAALAVAHLYGTAPAVAAEALAGFKGEKMRQQIMEAGGILIIDDTYNAGPDSMKAALSVLASMKDARRRIAVLADMLELGSFARQAHFEIGLEAVRLGIDLVLTVGENAAWIGDGVEAGGGDTRVERMTGNNEAIKRLHQVLKEGDAVLVKGSRGMRTEEIVNGIKPS